MVAKYKYIKCDVYNRGVTIFIGPRKELPKFVKKAYRGNKALIEEVETSVGSSALGTTFIEEYGQSLVWIPKFPKTPEELGTIAHEILHATFTLLDYVNVEYSYNGPNEPYTYLFEFLLTEALKEDGYEKVG